MTVCTRCHRPLRQPSPDGLGPVCRKASTPIPVIERDLFGYDTEAACAAARERIRAAIAGMGAAAHIALRRQVRQLRIEHGVWAK